MCIQKIILLVLFLSLMIMFSCYDESAIVTKVEGKNGSQGFSDDSQLSSQLIEPVFIPIMDEEISNVMFFRIPHVYHFFYRLPSKIRFEFYGTTSKEHKVIPSVFYAFRQKIQTKRIHVPLSFTTMWNRFCRFFKLTYGDYAFLVFDNATNRTYNISIDGNSFNLPPKTRSSEIGFNVGDYQIFVGRLPKINVPEVDECIEEHYIMRIIPGEWEPFVFNIDKANTYYFESGTYYIQ